MQKGVADGSWLDLRQISVLTYCRAVNNHGNPCSNEMGDNSSVDAVKNKNIG